MPPDGYTTVTIADETATKLAELTAHVDELGNMDDAIEHAVELALADQGTVAGADFARLLYERLSSDQSAEVVGI